MKSIITSLLLLGIMMSLNAETIPFLGVATSDINHSSYTNYGITDGYGILIKYVVEGSQAEKAGLKKDMIIRKYNDEIVYTKNQLTRMIRNSDVGKKVKITIWEKGVEQDFKVELGQREYVEHRKPVWMGVSLKEDFDQEDFVQNYGLMITLISEGSPADSAGLEVGDIMLELEGEKLYTEDQIRPMLKKFQPEDEVTIKYWREGKQMDIKLILGELSYDMMDMQAVDHIFSGLDILDGLDDVYGIWNSIGFPESMHVFAYQDSSSKILGVIVSETYNEDASEKAEGLKVDKVIPETPAAEGGMQAGDVILKINDKDVKDFDDIVNIISDVEYNDSFKVRILREGTPQDLILIMKPVTDDVWEKYYSDLLENDVIKLFLDKGKPLDFYYENLNDVHDKISDKIEYELKHSESGPM